MSTVRPFESSHETVIEREPTEAASLRAVAFDARTRMEDVDTNDSIRRRGSDDEPAEVAAPIRRIPLGARLLFGFVLGSCAVVLGLAAPALRADLAAMNAHRAAARAAPPGEQRSGLARAPASSAPIAQDSSRASMPTTSPDAPTVATTGTSVEAHRVATTASPSKGSRHASAGPEQSTRADGSASVGANASKATIRLAKKAHALRVDGKLAKGPSVEVSCGPHLVAVDNGKPRRVEAVCGQIVVVDEKKAKPLNGKGEAYRRSVRSHP